jgi:hypothetical protein
MVRIRRFNILKTATVVALMYMVVVAIIVVPFGLLLAVAGTAAQPQGGGVAAAIVLAVVAIFGYGLVGWIFTAIACAIYNVVAGWVGGIEVEVEQVTPPQPLPAWVNTGGQPPSTPAGPPTSTA